MRSLPLSLQNNNEIKVIQHCQKQTVKNILVIDDDPINRKTLALLLKSLKDFNLFEARNALLAYKVIEENEIDLIFVDFRMPHVNGLQFAEQMRAKEFNGNIVLLTGSADESITSENIEAVLFKPLRKQVLVDYLKFENIL